MKAAHRIVTRPAGRILPIWYPLSSSSFPLRSRTGPIAHNQTKFLGNERKQRNERDAAGRIALREIPLINLINAPAENKSQVACRCASF